MLVFYETEDKKKSGIVEVVRAEKEENHKIVCFTNDPEFVVRLECPYSCNDFHMWADTFLEELFSTEKAKITVQRIL